MDTPLVISGSGHAALILYLMFGGAFSSEPLPPVDPTEVSVISEEEFAALMRPEVGETAPPLRPAETPSAAVDPEAPEDQPPPEEPRVEEPAPEPEPVPEPEPEPVPEPEPEPEPEPVPEPPAAPEAPLAEENVPDEAPRVAPEATPEPPVEAEVAPTPQDATEPEPEEVAEPEPVEPEAPAAPEEATTEIVTEAEEPSSTVADAAPTISSRPRSRPERPDPVVAEPEPEPRQPEPDPPVETANDDAVQDAVNDTIAGLEQMVEQGEVQGAPAGPPLTQGEREGFRLQVRRCWNVDVGSEAADVTITVRFNMNPDNTVVSSSLTQTNVSGGSPAAQRTAFEWARRAILRCQVENGGYTLPADKYAQWQQVEVTFNPTDMRVR